MTQRTIVHISTALLLASSVGQLAAQGLSDPTKPPTGFNVAPGTVRVAEPSAALVLQSVLIGENSRSAIISGEHVLLGRKIGSLRLVKVGETEVVLLDGSARRTLKLFPGVEKRPASPTRDVTHGPRQ